MFVSWCLIGDVGRTFQMTQLARRFRPSAKLLVRNYRAGRMSLLNLRDVLSANMKCDEDKFVLERTWTISLGDL